MRDISNRLHSSLVIPAQAGIHRRQSRYGGGGPVGKWISVRNGGCSGLGDSYVTVTDPLGLYAIFANVFGFSEDHIEKKLFGPIDNNAAKVLEKFECHEEITQDDHIAWTFFLSSFRIRQPDTLEFLRTKGMKRLKATLSAQDAATLPPDAPTTEQWFNQHFPGGIEAASLTSWLPRMITHDDVAEAFGGLKWWIREFTPAEPKLLLSDLPFHWEGGLNDAAFLIQLPIAPDRIFFGARSEKTELLLDQMSVPELIRRVNITTLASSSQRVWASTREEAQAFIEANLDMIGKNVVRFDELAPWAAQEVEGGI